MPLTRSHISLLCPLILIAMFCTALTGCGPDRADIEKARTQVTAFHRSLNKADYAAIVQGTDYEYRKSSQQDDLVAPFRAVHERYGNALESQQDSEEARRMIGATRIVLRQKTHFERGDITETFTFLVRDHQSFLLRYEVSAGAGH